jgi:chromosome segregation ATPase
MPARAQPRQRFPRVAWVLAISAFLCGAMVSAAAFAVGWKHEAQKGSSAQAALLAATARNHVLSGAVVSARAAALTARTSARHARGDAASAQAATAALRQRAAALASALASTGSAASSVVDGTSSVSSELSKLTSELHTLTTYLTTTPSRQVDPGYVASQTAYITKSIDRIAGDENSLASTAAAYQRAARAAAANASALAGR